MENRPGRQNKRQPTSEGEEGEESSAIYDRTNYHIWSLFSRQSDGLLQLDPSLNNLVLCNGAFSDKTGKTIVTTRDISTNPLDGTQSGKLHFTHLDSGKQYVIAAEDEGKGNFKIIAMEEAKLSDPDKAAFVYHWYGCNSYIMFENKSYKKYLVCDSNGNTTLVDMDYPDHPNPQALFILNMLSEN